MIRSKRVRVAVIKGAIAALFALFLPGCVFTQELKVESVKTYPNREKIAMHVELHLSHELRNYVGEFRMGDPLLGDVYRMALGKALSKHAKMMTRSVFRDVSIVSNNAPAANSSAVSKSTKGLRGQRRGKRGKRGVPQDQSPDEAAERRTSGDASVAVAQDFTVETLSGQQSNADAILTLQVVQVRHEYRHEFVRLRVQIMTELEWTLTNTKNEIVWIKTIEGVGEAKTGLSMKELNKEGAEMSIEDVFFKSFEEFFASAEVRKFAASR